MKKTIALALSIIMIATLLLTLTACDDKESETNNEPKETTDIKGTWEFSNEEISLTYIFEENGNFTIKVTNPVSDDSTETTGTYKTDGNKVTITVAEDDLDGSETYTFEIKGNTLKMAPVDDPDDFREFAKK